MAAEIKELLSHFHQNGKIEWIGLRPEKGAEIKPVSSARITPGGLQGDHYQGTSGKRDVTLVQAEHLKTVGSLLGKAIDPAQIRRNIVVSGINLLALKDKQFQVGKEVVLMTTGACHPCSRMEKNLGFGGYNAMRGHGGITARVVRGGEVKEGDEIQVFKTE